MPERPLSVRKKSARLKTRLNQGYQPEIRQEELSCSCFSPDFYLGFDNVHITADLQNAHNRYPMGTFVIPNQ